MKDKKRVQCAYCHKFIYLIQVTKDKTFGGRIIVARNGEAYALCNSCEKLFEKRNGK